jgi:hypothetical protein
MPLILLAVSVVSTTANERAVHGEFPGKDAAGGTAQAVIVSDITSRCPAIQTMILARSNG